MSKHFLILLSFFGSMLAMEEGNSSKQEVKEWPSFYNVPILWIRRLFSSPNSNDPEADTKRLQAAVIASQLSKLSVENLWRSFSDEMGEPCSQTTVLQRVCMSYGSPIVVMGAMGDAVIGTRDKHAIYGVRKSFEEKKLPDNVYCNLLIISPDCKRIIIWVQGGGVAVLANDEIGKTDHISCITGTNCWDQKDVHIAFLDEATLCIRTEKKISVGNVEDFVQCGPSSLMQIHSRVDEFPTDADAHLVSTFAPGIIAAIAPDREFLEFFCRNGEGKYVMQRMGPPGGGKIFCMTKNPRAHFLAVCYRLDMRSFAVFQFENGEVVSIKMPTLYHEQVEKCEVSPSGTHLVCVIPESFTTSFLKIFDMSARKPDKVQLIYTVKEVGSVPGLCWTYGGIHIPQGPSRILTVFFDSITPVLEKYYDRMNKNRGIKREIGDSGKAEKVSKFSE